MLKKKWCAILLTFCMIFTVMPSDMQGATKKANEQGKNLSNSWLVGGYYAKGCCVGNTLYYSVYNKLYKMNIKTGKKKLLYKYDCFSLESIQYYNDKLYVVIDKFEGTGGSYPYITSIKTNGTGYKLLAVGSNLSIAGGKLYYIKQTELSDFDTFDPVGIYSMKLDGKSKKCIMKNDILEFAACNGKKIYYSTILGTYQTDLKAKKKKKLANKGEEVIGVYNNEVYYTVTNESSNKCELYQRNITSARVRKLDRASEIISARIDVETGKLIYIKPKDKSQVTILTSLNLKTFKKSTILQLKNICAVSLFGKHIMYTIYDGDQMQTKFYTLANKKRKHLAKYFVS